MREITAQWGSEPKPFWVCGNLSTNFHGLQSALSLRCQSDWHLPPTLPYFPMVIYQLEWKSVFCLFFHFFKESLMHSNWLLKEKSLYSYGMGISVRKWMSLIPNLARGILKWVNWDQICLRTHHWPYRGRTEAHMSQHLLPDSAQKQTHHEERGAEQIQICTQCPASPRRQPLPWGWCLQGVYSWWIHLLGELCTRSVPELASFLRRPWSQCHAVFLLPASLPRLIVQTRGHGNRAVPRE